MDTLIKIAIVPVALLLYFIYKKDPHPESSKLLWKVFGFGCLTTIPVVICELLYDNVLKMPDEGNATMLLLNTFLGVGLIEEFFKWLVVWWLCYRNRDFDETYDAIVYASYSSLGFACVENILFVVINGAGTGIMRAITTVPGHLCLGVIMGYFFGRARKNKADGKSSVVFVILSLIVSAILHTFFDYFIFMAEYDNLAIILWFVFIIIQFIVCFIVVTHISKHNERISDALTADKSVTITPAAPTAAPTGPAPIAPAEPTSSAPIMPIELTAPINAASATSTQASDPSPISNNANTDTIGSNESIQPYDTPNN